ncbi:hypothetical protein EVAR_57376_1 [Eumeta japonica]|uniref:Uncharacterized protein n=1 Tax=Eumeta variegata TaxID=151549 RepID=A0A4C1ZI70_EUMVA|nr:hypothetical protein EVAR_57376_1 [Eumeta japonica]
MWGVGAAWGGRLRQLRPRPAPRCKARPKPRGSKSGECVGTRSRRMSCGHTQFHTSLRNPRVAPPPPRRRAAPPP